jgi:uncharacterized protein
MIIKKFIVFFILFPVFLKAQNYPAKPVNYVTDETGVLTNEQKLNLNTKLAEFEKNTSNQFFIYMTQSLNGSDIASMCQEIFHAWQIGSKNNNNGLLIAIFTDDHKFRIHTGYGLEGSLPDILTKRIQDNDMAPLFKENDYYSGIDKGLDQLIYYSKNEFKPEDEESKSPKGFEEWAYVYLINAILLLMFLYSIVGKKAKYRKPKIKTFLLITAIVVSFLPCVGALILYVILLVLGEVKIGLSFRSTKGSSSYFGSSDSSSSSDSGFDGGGGGDSGGGGSDSSW